MTKRDFAFVGALMLIYSIIAFYRLGNTVSPQTSWIFPQDDFISIDFGEVRDIDELQYMTASFVDKEFTVYFSEDNENWASLELKTTMEVFYWHSVQFEEFPMRYVLIESSSDYIVLQEMAFRYKGELIPIPFVSENAKDLFDEQEYVPQSADYMNSTYFDEIYHARTAYEFIYKLPVYEWTHPPLGKFIMSWGIKIFGMTPFGWRFMGTLFGVFMILPVYIFAKRIFGSVKWAFLVAFIFTFDFMHFTQTRLATIDTYVTTFTLIMYYFMFVYATEGNIEKHFYKSLVPLACSGVFMGLAISAKWQGVYAVAGLAVTFFIALIGRRKQLTTKQIAVTLGFCVVFFVIIPISIYLISYIPFLNTYNQIFGLKGIIDNNINMYYYHSLLVDEHPFTSRWWTWPLLIRPMFYYSGDLSNGIKQGISSFGNPAVWWTGILAFVYCIYSYIRYRDRTVLYLIIGYLSQYLPWVFISRTTYIYHYFPSIPFVVLMIVYFLKNTVYIKIPKSIYVYAVLVIGLFIMFYPVLSGMPISEGYVKYLKWMPTWQLIF